MIGYGAMLMESFVAVMALIAAVCFASGRSTSPSTVRPAWSAAARRDQTISGWGYPVTAQQMRELAADVGRDHAA